MENSKLAIYRVILIILIILAIVMISLILKKRYEDFNNENMNNEILADFNNLEEKNDEIDVYMQGHKVIGKIEIPEINLEYPILEKTTKETMKISISKFYGGEVNSYGNVSLAGHNNYSGTMFGKNKNLKVGDKVYLTSLDKVKIEYVIYSIFTTNPDDTSVVETIDESVREVTLITCKNGRSERLIVKAKENL